MKKYGRVIGYPELVSGLLGIGFLVIVGCASQRMTAGKVYVQEGEYAKAIEQFKLQLEERPQDADAMLWLGRIYAYQKEYEEACKYVDKAKEIAPTKPDFTQERGFLWSLYFNAGIYANRDEAYELATKRFIQAIEYEPDSVHTYLNLALVYSNLGETDSVVAYYKRATEVAPKNAEGYRYLGVHYIKEKDYDAAISWLKKAQDIEPGDCDVSYRLGICYYLKEAYADAETAFRRAIECDTTLVNAYFNLSASLIKQGKYPEGIEVLEKTVALNPEDIEALAQLASIYYLSERYEDAVETYTKIIALAPDNWEAYEGRALSYLKLGKKVESESDRKQAEELKKR